MKFVPLFPPYLDVGSTGVAVKFLQVLLISLGCNMPSLTVNGVYDTATVRSVKKLQRKVLFLVGRDVDGNFGPLTRERLASSLGAHGSTFNVNRIPADAFPGVTRFCGPKHKGMKEWPAAA